MNQTSVTVLPKHFNFAVFKDGVHSALVRINEELLEKKSSGSSREN
jgi:hypothetical protein